MGAGGEGRARSARYSLTSLYEGTLLARPPREREASSGLPRRDRAQYNNRDNEHIFRETLRVRVPLPPDVRRPHQGLSHSTVATGCRTFGEVSSHLSGDATFLDLPPGICKGTLAPCRSGDEVA